MFSNFPAQFASYANKWLPARSVGWLRHKRNAWRKQRRARLRLALIERHGSFTAQQLMTACRAAGVRENGVLFVHCSLDDLFTYKVRPTNC
jgi:hypothetical protein